MKDILPGPRVSMLALKLCGVLLSLRLPLSLYAQVTPDSGAGLADAWRARVSEESEQYINTLRAERLRVKTALVEVQESPGRVWQASPDVVGARDPAPFTSTLNALLRGGSPDVKRWEEYFSGPGGSRLGAAVERLGPFRDRAEDIFAQAGLPPDLIVVGFVESEFVSDAVSSKGATGP